MSTTLIRNAHVVTASEEREADLFIDGEKVALIGRDLSLPADTVIDASGNLIPVGSTSTRTSTCR
jgi:dihydropyrimidinase